MQGGRGFRQGRYVIVYIALACLHPAPMKIGAA
jgi:hypothetical protein